MTDTDNDFEAKLKGIIIDALSDVKCVVFNTIKNGNKRWRLEKPIQTSLAKKLRSAFTDYRICREIYYGDITDNYDNNDRLDLFITNQNNNCAIEIKIIHDLTRSVYRYRPKSSVLHDYNKLQSLSDEFSRYVLIVNFGNFYNVEGTQSINYPGNRQGNRPFNQSCNSPSTHLNWLSDGLDEKSDFNQIIINELDRPNSESEKNYVIGKNGEPKVGEPWIGFSLIKV